MNENCIKDEKFLIKFAPWMKKLKSYKMNGKLGRNIAQWMKIENKNYDEWKIEKLNFYKEWNNEKMWWLIYPGRTLSINPFT